MTNKGEIMDTNKKSARRSRCHHCSRAITERQVVKAVDANRYIAEYGSYDDELVWVDNKSKKAICDDGGLSTGHMTQKEWEINS